MAFNVGGLSGQPLPQMPQLNMNPAPAPKAQGGMFAHGAGKFLTDFILNYAAGMGNPIGTEHLDAMRQKQAQAMQEAHYQQQRNDKWSDFTREYDYRQQHPGTPEPTEFERAVQASGLQPGTPEYTNLMRQFVTNRANPMQALDVTQPDGSVMRQFIRPSGAGVPQAPVGKLTPIGGGPTPQASGTFPR